MKKAAIMMKVLVTVSCWVGWLLALLGSPTQAFRPTPTSTTTHHRSHPAVRTTTSTTDAALSWMPSHHHRQYRRHAADANGGVRLYMGWGPDPVWSTATIAQISDACPSGKTVALTLAVPPTTAAEYKIPGQYVQVRPANESDAKPSFLAMASAPDAENAQFQFLIKKNDSVAWLTTGLTVGAALDISQVLGKGYAVADNLDGFKYDFPTQNVILCAAGSGIAPLAAVMESDLLQLASNGRTCRLYYGEQTADDLCCVQQFAAWEEKGIEVVPVLSRADANWQGRLGYVQTALEEDGIPIPRNSGALLCGMKGMTEAVSELLKKAGVFDARILFNF